MNIFKTIKNIMIRKTHQFTGFFLKDVILLLKRKKYLYLTLLFPLILSVIYIFIISPKPAELNIGVCSQDANIYADQLFGDQEGFRIKSYTADACFDKNLTQVKKDIQKNKIIAFVQIPRYFTASLERYQSTNIFVYTDNTDLPLSNLINWRINDAIQGYKHEIVNEANSHFKGRVKDVSTGVNIITKYMNYLDQKTLLPIQNDLEKTNKTLGSLQNIDTYFLLNPIAVELKEIHSLEDQTSVGLAFIFPIIALFVTFMLASTNIIFDRTTNYLTRIRSSNATLFSYAIAKIAFFTCLTVIQFGIVIILFLGTGTSFSINWLSLIEGIAFIALVNTTIGIIIGLVSENEGIAVLLSLLLTLPFMFLSGIFYSIKIMPKIFQIVANIFPLNTQINVMKQAIIFNNSFNHSLWYMGLSLFIVMYFLLKRKEI